MAKKTPPVGQPNTLAGRLKDPFETFRIYEIIIAVVCVSIPLWLLAIDSEEYYPKPVSSTFIEELKGDVRLKASFDSLKQAQKTTSESINRIDSLFQRIEKDRLGFRLSISDYVYSENAHIFGMLLTIGGMLFVINGVIYFRSQHSLKLNSKGKWYNVILGISLLGVVSTPHREFQFLHYGFAFIFFVGNAVVIALFHKESDRVKRIVMGAATLLLISLSLITGNYITLLWSEWLSLTVIGLHVLLEAQAKNRS